MKLRKNCIDETGHIYGKLTVIEPYKRPEDRKMMWKCKCACGNEIICSGSDLRTGRRTSCGKHCNFIKDETGKTYGFLTVLEQDPKPHPGDGIWWICKCNLCGNVKSISGHNLRRGDTKSCGCVKSSGEVLTRQILEDLGYKYSQEQRFKDLVSPLSSSQLRFDFAIFHDEKLLFVIEVQGEQHEKQISYFGNKLNQIRLCDAKKREYCRDRDIPILYIPYINGKLPNKDDLQIQIQEFYEECL